MDSVRTEKGVYFGDSNDWSEYEGISRGLVTSCYLI